MAKRRPPPPPRDGGGRFLKNHSGNPSGRPKASPKKAADSTFKLRVKQGGKIRLVKPQDLIMQKLAKSAATEDGLAATRLFLREERLRARTAARAAPPTPARLRSKHQTLYYEEALLALGVLKRNRWGQLVIARSVFADLDRLYSKGAFTARAWRAIQLAVESPQELRHRFPGKRLTYTTEAAASRARAEAIEAAFAEYDAMAAELAELKAMKPRR